MKNLLRIVIHPLCLLLLVLLALAGLAWWAGAAVGFGDVRPFGSPGRRLGALGVLAALWLAAAGIHLWRRRRAGNESTQTDAGMGENSTDALERRFGEGLAILGERARKSGQRGLFTGDRYRYQLPWYLLIGAPGAGKTTALANAGLSYPLAARMGQAAGQRTVGTRDCDWWFSTEAVLIDTAGRLALQQSDEAADAAGWQRLLVLLRQARPRRPLDGVLLAVNLRDLLQQGAANRREHAAMLRARLQELHEKLGVRPPVYLLVTKTDLIAGFEESFASLDMAGREQVWGFGFPYDITASGRPLDPYDSEFAALEKRLRERLLERMQAEAEPARRAAIFGFQQQFGGIRSLLNDFLGAVFTGGGTLEEPALLRGVYFTSATQEDTPIDRVRSALARHFGLQGRAATTGPRASGNGYFLTRLLREVVFAEKGLVAPNRQVEARRRRRRWLGMAGIALASLALAAAWAASYRQNVAYVAEVAARLPALKSAVDGLPPTSGSDVSQLPQVLDQVVATPRTDRFDSARPPWRQRLGLYQGDALQAGADTGYRRLLDHALLPRVAQRLEERLRAVNHDNLETAYEALKAYLMLCMPEHFNAASMQNWVTLDWDANLADTLSPEQRESLAEHLAAALSDNRVDPPWPMDKALVADVRALLASYPLEFRAFSRMQRIGVGSEVPAFSVASAGGPAAAEVFERASGQPITLGIPGLFTRAGYFGAFQDVVGPVVVQLELEQGWVLAMPRPAPAGPAEVAALTDRVRRLYLKQYIALWDAYLGDVRLVALDDLPRSLEVARVMAAPASPLPGYLRAVVAETSLLTPPSTDAQAGRGTGGQDQTAVDARQQMATMMGAGPDIRGASAGAPTEAMVDQHFAYLHHLLQGRPAPLDDVMRLFNEVYLQLDAIDAARKSQSAPPPASGAAGGALRASTALQPEPIRTMLAALADAGSLQGHRAERHDLSAELKPIADFCARTIAGRYPFAPGAEADVLPNDFGQFFGTGGMLDEFYQRRLAAVVDVGSTPWSYKPLTDGRRPPGGAALANFQRGARIREAFFQNGGRKPGFRFDLRLVDMDPGMKELVLDVDGQQLHFGAGSSASQTVQWPGQRLASRISIAAGGVPQVFEGPWAMFRLLNHFELQPSPQPERFTVVLKLDGRQARLEVVSGSAINPLRMREMQAFRCPDTL